MVRIDLRNMIIPTTLKNTDPFYGKVGNRKFNTTDLIYLDSYNEQFDNKKNNIDRRQSITDFAQMNYAYIFNINKTVNGQPAAWIWLRSSSATNSIACILGNGEEYYTSTSYRSASLSPSLRFELSDNIKSLSFREVKDSQGNIIYHTVQLGEYPKTKVDNDLSNELERLYNNGNINDKLICTGRWYSTNGQKRLKEDYIGKHVPEFEYNGERFVRVVSYTREPEDKYSDGTASGSGNSIKWVKVEPISFVIRNWNEMPKAINPKGNGRAKYFDLRAEEGIISNIPFYPDDDDNNSTMWQNSTIRGFLNGIDVRNIRKNGNTELTAKRGGDFRGECNFLNDAFNLSREPITEYTIPESEAEIPDDAFNGCLTLDRITIHREVKSIGNSAFDGLDFKYAYKNRTGELVLVKELSKEDMQYNNIIELDRLKKAFFDEFDYNILVQCDNFKHLIKLSEVLNKNMFRIPYTFGIELIKNGNLESFCEKSDFRFFKNELPDINEKLMQVSVDEKLNFFKFANNLGCFSTNKILDKKSGTFAQKASSLLAIILNNSQMKLR